MLDIEDPKINVHDVCSQYAFKLGKALTKSNVRDSDLFINIRALGKLKKARLLQDWKIAYLKNKTYLNLSSWRMEKKKKGFTISVVKLHAEYR